MAKNKTPAKKKIRGKEKMVGRGSQVFDASADFAEKVPMITKFIGIRICQMFDSCLQTL